MQPALNLFFLRTATATAPAPIAATKQRHCSYINIRSVQNSFCHLLPVYIFLSVAFCVCTHTALHSSARSFYLAFSMLHFIVQISYPLICGTARVMNVRSAKVTR